MACFLVPTAEAIVTTIVTKAEDKKEANLTAEEKSIRSSESKIPFSRKLRWLSRLLIGGSVLLAFEHLWHGEIVPWFPFLTAASDPAEASVMLHEMSTVGVAMALLITAVWVVMCVVANSIVHRDTKEILPDSEV